MKISRTRQVNRLSTTNSSGQEAPDKPYSRTRPNSRRVARQELQEKPDEEVLADQLQALGLHTTTVPEPAGLYNLNDLATQLDQLSADNIDEEVREDWLSIASQATWAYHTNDNAFITVKNSKRDITPPNYLLCMTDMDSDGPAHVPIHDVILRTQLARFSNLPATLPYYQSYHNKHNQPTNTRLVQIPITPIHLSVPHLVSMSLLLLFCYLQDSAYLFTALTGFAFDNMTKQMQAKISKQLATSYTSTTIEDRIDYIKGLIRNGEALGVRDEKFWSTIDMAQEIYLRALFIKLDFDE